MAQYPVRVPPDLSGAKRGQERRRYLNALGRQLEDHINAKLEARPAGPCQLFHANLARELGVPEDDVRAALARLPGAEGNGFTVWKR